MPQKPENPRRVAFILDLEWPYKRHTCTFAETHRYTRLPAMSALAERCKCTKSSVANWASRRASTARNVGLNPKRETQQTAERASAWASAARLDVAKACPQRHLQRHACGLLNRRSQVRVLSGVVRTMILAMIRGLSLYAGSGACDEILNFVESRHCCVARCGHGQGAVGGAVLDGLAGRFARQQCVDQARGE